MQIRSLVEKKSNILKVINDLHVNSISLISIPDYKQCNGKQDCPGKQLFELSSLYPLL